MIMRVSAQHTVAAGDRPGLGELGYAVGTAVLALVVTAATLSGRAATVAVLLALQLAFTLGWLSLLRWATKLPDVVIVMATAAAADLILLQNRHTTAGSLAGVIGLSFLATLVRQLPRGDRSHLTDSLIALMSGIAITVAPSVLVVLARADSARAAAAAGMFAAGAAALAGRLGDLILVWPRLPGTSTRGGIRARAGIRGRNRGRHRRSEPGGEGASALGRASLRDRGRSRGRRCRARSRPGTWQYRPRDRGGGARGHLRPAVRRRPGRVPGVAGGRSGNAGGVRASPGKVCPNKAGPSCGDGAVVRGRGPASSGLTG